MSLFKDENNPTPPNAATMPQLLKSDSLEDVINAFEQQPANPIAPAPPSKKPPTAGRRRHQLGTDRASGQGVGGVNEGAGESSNDNIAVMLNQADSSRSSVDGNNVSKPTSRRSSILLNDAAPKAFMFNSKPTTAITQDIDDSSVPKGRRGSRSNGFAFSGEEGGKKGSFVVNVANADEVADDLDGGKRRVRQTIVGSGSVENVGGVIPDLTDVADEDIGAQIADAPNVKPKTMKTIGELESDIAYADTIANQLQHLGVPGLDFSILINASLCPPEQLVEPDQPWDWDIVFTQVSTEIKKSLAQVA